MSFGTAAAAAPARCPSTSCNALMRPVNARTAASKSAVAKRVGYFMSTSPHSFLESRRPNGERVFRLDRRDSGPQGCPKRKARRAHTKRGRFVTAAPELSIVPILSKEQHISTGTPWTTLSSDRLGGLAWVQAISLSRLFGVVSRIFTSWNHLGDFLRSIDALRRAARHRRGWHTGWR